eukprot:CAMPEP_0172447040 /NCGR_PEP_ID=MMETSP1065-20121228/6435_1 /TAXON_ID=265537 /ORGANISM="Amphiprora paludosa, Strain CCMP125" /LENGTH=351 /DNA_ID=CAMNT_0013198247 /DNA_START=304 /DNA_END=1359 /DNA_ORIENTATION=+
MPILSSVSSNEELLPGIQSIQQGNAELFQRLENLRGVPYFRLYSVDILASCEYLPQELFECYTEGCEILPVDEEEVPENIRGMDRQEAVFELDGWGRWDMPTEDYYDIQDYTEGYTGYDGSDVWNYIHDRICFPEYDKFGASTGHWKADFNKALSGLHSLISAQVIRGIQEKIDNNEPFDGDGEIHTDPNAEFQRRLQSVPMAMENLYFLHMLLLAAVTRARDRLLQESRNYGVMEVQSVFDSQLLNDPTGSTAAASRRFQMYASADPNGLWEARMRTRELIRIMNCVQCNKCRLHGKISTMGLSTALKLLLGGSNGTGEDPSRIHRVELSTLVTTLHKCSRAIDTCQSMQ